MMQSWTKDSPVCVECKCQHAPISYRCPFKIRDDAKVVWDAGGAAFTWDMLTRLICDLKAKLPSSQWNEMRLVSVKPEAVIYQGLNWAKNENLPPDMIVCETGDSHGVLMGFVGSLVGAVSK